MPLTDQPGAVVTTDDVQGTFTILPPQNGQTEPMVRLTFPNANPVIVPTSLLVYQGNEPYRLPLPFSRLADASNIAAVIPLVAEQLHVRKEEIFSGGVRVTKSVRHETTVIDEPLFREDIQVERVPKNEYIETPAGVRREGNATIVPLYEEVLVVQKRLLLREELVIRKQSFEFHSPQQVTWRREEATVEELKEPIEPKKELAPREPLAQNLKTSTAAKTKRRKITKKESDR